MGWGAETLDRGGTGGRGTERQVTPGQEPRQQKLGRLGLGDVAEAGTGKTGVKVNSRSQGKDWAPETREPFRPERWGPGKTRPRARNRGGQQKGRGDKGLRWIEPEHTSRKNSVGNSKE